MVALDGDCAMTLLETLTIARTIVIPLAEHAINARVIGAINLATGLHLLLHAGTTVVRRFHGSGMAKA